MSDTVIFSKLQDYKDYLFDQKKMNPRLQDAYDLLQRNDDNIIA